MIRTALRLATLAVLQNGGKEPWPTVAKDNIYDSRRDDLDMIQERMRRPVIVIRTDDDNRVHRHGGGNIITPELQNRSIDLQIEVSVVTARKDGEEWVVGWPQTDPALESVLDLMELQIENCLSGLGEWSQWWRRNGWALSGWSSRPEYLREKAHIRLAARTISIPIISPQETMAGWYYEDEDVPGIEPPKRLGEVLTYLDANSSGDVKTAATQIKDVLEARGWPEAMPQPPLLRIRQTTYIGEYESFEAEQLGELPELEE